MMRRRIGQCPAFALALPVLLFAFALRVYGLGSVRHTFDGGYPHGQGIAIAESIVAGRFSALPTLSLTSTIGLPNGATNSYLWAIVALFEPLAYSAVFISAVLSVLGVAMVFSLARRLTNSSLAAVVSASLAAASLWGAFIARETTVQGQAEVWATAAGWLLLSALHMRNGRVLLLGYVVIALALHSYTVALVMIAQAALIGLVAVTAFAALRKYALVGLTLCLASLGLYLFFVSRNSDILQDITTQGLQNRLTGPVDEVTESGDRRINFVGWDHARRFVSSRDFEVLTDTAAPAFAAYKAANDVRAWVIDMLTYAGVALCILARRFRRPAMLATVLWFIAPVALLTIGGLIAGPRLSIGVHYLTLASPAGYVLAGLSVAQARSVNSLTLRRTFNTLFAVTCLMAASVSAWIWHAHVSDAYANPLARDIFDVPLNYQHAIGRIWRERCAEIDNPEIPYYWVVSLLGNTHRLRWAAANWNELSIAWEVRPGGGNCFTRIERVDALSPALDAVAQVVPLERIPLIADQGAANTFKSGAIDIVASDHTPPLAVNLGWKLLRLDAPHAVEPGATGIVLHVWKIESLPSEAHDHWYFAPFVKLIAPDGQVIVDIDQAKSVEGYNWRAGDYLVSAIALKVPENVAPGAYTLALSLFDTNQKINAAYFDAARPGEPIVVIERKLQIEHN